MQNIQASYKDQLGGLFLITLNEASVLITLYKLAAEEHLHAQCGTRRCAATSRVCEDSNIAPLSRT